MRKSLALAFAALAFSAGAALASPPASSVTGDAAALNGVRTAQMSGMPLALPGGESEATPMLNETVRAPMPADISGISGAERILLQNSSVSLVNQTGGGQ